MFRRFILLRCEKRAVRCSADSHSNERAIIVANLAQGLPGTDGLTAGPRILTCVSRFFLFTLGTWRRGPA